jgi:Fe-S-cluster containining protein
MGKFASAKKKNPVYERFVPTSARSDGPRREKSEEKISYYSCKCLTKDNWCSHYDTRPSFCKNYPLSSFIQEEKVLKGCGFRIQRKNYRPKIRNKALKSLVDGVLQKNELD